MDRQSIISQVESTGGQSNDSWQPGLDPEDERALEQAREDSTAIVEEIPTDEDGLGWFSVICLLFNRMIGTLCSRQVDALWPWQSLITFRVWDLQQWLCRVSKHPKHWYIPIILALRLYGSYLWSPVIHRDGLGHPTILEKRHQDFNTSERRRVAICTSPHFTLVCILSPVLTKQ